jgi:hypothetical protein
MELLNPFKLEKIWNSFQEIKITYIFDGFFHGQFFTITTTTTNIGISTSKSPPPPPPLPP